MTATAPDTSTPGFDPCPVERFAAWTAHAINRRTLSKIESDERLAALRAALGITTATAIAKRANVTLGRISQLARRIRPASEEVPA